MYPRRICCAEQCSGVLRVLNAVKEEQKRILAAGTCCCNNLLNRNIGNRGSIGNHALMAYTLRHRSIQLRAADDICRNPILSRKVAQLPHTAAVKPVSEQNAVDPAPRLHRLHDCMAAGKNVGAVLCRARAALVLFRMLHSTLHYPRGIKRSSHGSSATIRSRIRNIISLISHCAPGVVTRFS